MLVSFNLKFFHRFNLILISFFLFTSIANPFYVIKEDTSSPLLASSNVTNRTTLIPELTHDTKKVVSETSPKEELKESSSSSTSTNLGKKLGSFKSTNCEIPPNWEYFANMLSNLFSSINKKNPLVKLNETFSMDVKGRINLLGTISGFQANYVYFRELPRIILSKTNFEFIKVDASHYSATCNIVSAIHRLHFKGLLQPSTSTPSTSYLLRKKRKVPSSFLNTLFHNTPKEKIRKTPPPVIQTIVLEVWSWWKFNTEGRIMEYELSLQRSDFLDWHDLFPERPEMLHHVCSEFSNTEGSCAKSKLPGEFRDTEVCLAALSHPIISLKEVTCRYLVSFLREEFPNLACFQMGIEGKLCTSPTVQWDQGIVEGEETNTLVPKIPVRVDL